MVVLDHGLRRAVGFSVGVSLLAYGCSSNSGNGNPDGGSTTPSECQLPACYYDFVTAVQVCVPKGTCVQQDDVTPTVPVTRMCYSNGAKVVNNGADINGSFSDIIYGPDGKICYLFNGALMADPMTGAISLAMATILNANGDVVATIHADRSISANCAGDPPKTVAASCNVPMPSNATSQCTMGTCM
jgi:hypothetical protein